MGIAAEVLRALREGEFDQRVFFISRGTSFVLRFRHGLQTTELHVRMKREGIRMLYNRVYFLCEDCDGTIIRYVFYLSCLERDAIEEVLLQRIERDEKVKNALVARML